ncbi:MAG TPA: polysaccharide biosynthesis tyrosine autokinase [Chthoniobacterales bacterium]
MKPYFNGNASPSKANPGIPEIDFHKIFHIIRARWWLLAITSLLAIAAAVAYLMVTPKSYSAETIVEVLADDRNPTGLQDPEGDGGLEKAEVLKTIEFKLGTRDLIESMIQTQKLTPEELGLPAGTPKSYLVDFIRGSTSAALVRGTRLISVSGSHTNPEMAARLANDVVREYLASLVKQRSQLADKANQFLVDESNRLKVKLQASEEALHTYRNQSGAVSLEEKQNIIVDQLKELNTHVTQAKAERLKYEAALDQVKNPEKMSLQDLLAIPAIATAPGVVDQRSQVATQEATVAELGERYGDQHPKLFEARRRLQQTLAGLNAAAVGAARSLKTSYDAAKETETKYQQVLDEQSKKALELDQMAIRYNVLSRDVASDTATFDSILARLKESSVTRSIVPGFIRVVETAEVPKYPTKPKGKLILIAAIPLGIFAGLGLVFLLHAFDRSFRTVDDVQDSLGYQVLGVIPRLSAQRLEKLQSSYRSSDSQPPTQVVEAFRTLRTTTSVNTQELRTLLFTSAEPEEGKSFTAINYAISTARLREPVLLIDGNLRTPTVEEALLGQKGVKPGIFELLHGLKTFDEVVHQTLVPNLFVLPAGIRQGNPEDLVSKDWWQDLILQASKRFRNVVIDSTSLLGVGDTLLLAGNVDAVCLVVRSGGSSRKAVSKASQLLESVGATIAGVALNQVPEKSASYYHYGSGAQEVPPASAVIKGRQVKPV